MADMSLKVVVALVIVVLAAGLAGCVGCGVDEGSSSAPTDDDLTPSGDDDTGGSTPDDDSTPPIDDDDDDDSTPPIDDDDDDDNDDNNDAAFDEIITPRTVFEDENIRIQRLFGGAPGHAGVDIAANENGVFAVWIEGRTLLLAEVSGEKMSDPEAVAEFASTPTLAIDAGDNVHVAFQDLRTETVRYGVKISGQWSFASFGTRAAYEKYPIDLAIDSAGAAHVAYLGDNNDILYATNVTGEWRVETVDSSTVTETAGPAIIVDENDGIHLFYCLEYNVRQAFHDETGWTINDVITEVFSPRNLVGGTTPEGKPAFAFSAYNRLVVGKWNGATWQTQEASFDFYTNDLGADFSQLDGPRVLLPDHDENRLWYVSFVGEAPEWEIAVEGVAAGFIGLTATPDDGFFALFYDYQIGELWRADRAVQDWTSAGVTNVGKNVSGSSLDKTPTGASRATFAATRNGISTLWYGTPFQERWGLSRVTEHQTTGNALALVGERPVVSYWDNSQGQLCVTSPNHAGNWIEKVITVPPVTDNPSYNRIALALDDETIHVAACGSTGYWGRSALAYASSDTNWQGELVWSSVWGLDCFVDVIAAGGGNVEIAYSEQFLSPFFDGRYTLHFNEKPLTWDRHTVAGGEMYDYYGYGLSLVAVGRDERKILCREDYSGLALAEGTAQGDWTTTQVVSDHYVGDTQLVVDEDGNLWWAYARVYGSNSLLPAADRAIIVGRQSGDDWVTRMVDYGGAVGEYDIDMYLTDDEVVLLYTGEGAVWLTTVRRDYFE